MEKQQKTFMGKPVFEMVFDPKTSGVAMISLVDDPAIEVKWQAFGSNATTTQVPVFHSQMNEEQRIITGPIMVPGTMIYRKGDKTAGEPEEFYEFYTAETVKAAMLHFARAGRWGNKNVMHQPYMPEGVYIFESFLLDRDRGKMPPTGFETLPDGTWFGSYKVDNEQVWQAVKEGGLNGFSIEGFFGLKQAHSRDELRAAIDALHAQLSSLPE